MKTGMALLCGSLVILTSVITLIANLALILVVVRSLWNILFGLILLALQLGWAQGENSLMRNFGFLKHWFMRGFFYLFVGTNVMHCGDHNWMQGECLLSITIGLMCIFVGTVELLFGFKCHEKNDGDEYANAEGGAAGLPAAAESSKKKGKNKAGSGSEGVGITITPGQAVQGAQWAAKNPNTVKKGAELANKANGGGGSSGGGDNPFFGNTHLK
jgi:hypothetical protein